MPLKTSIPMAVSLALLIQAVPASAQNLIPANNANLYPLGPKGLATTGQPRAFGRLFVQLEVMPACTVDAGGSVSIRCTRGVVYRAWVLNDTDAGFGRFQVGDSRPASGSGELVRIEAQRLDVEF
ncbi:hypothetical protein [Rhodanobacter sp. L36]|uniref:hypothetical protein n=1 Tax=Rhodanobacter sp. L36 TaxID=1747221 RepID=UPI00131B5A65|nr:hypothetical protein [Rhodanobacter sp. L36]